MKARGLLTRVRRALAIPAFAISAFAISTFAIPAFGADRPLGTPPSPPRIEIQQQLDAQLPLDSRFADALGRAVRLGDYFAGSQPVVLVLGYYTCPNLCGLAMHGVLEALHDTGLPPSAYRVVGISVDPQDTPATALERQQLYTNYAAFLRDGATGRTGSSQPAVPALDLLVGASPTTASLARRVGFGYQIDAEAAEAPAGSERALARYAHAVGLIVATPDGRVSRYFMGVRFDPDDLRLALVEASSGGIGSLADRLVLLCSHFDPVQGRYSGAVMNVMRVVGVLLVVALASWMWRRRSEPTGSGHRSGR